METRVFSSQGHACQVRHIRWPQEFACSFLPVAGAGQGAGVGDLGLEPGLGEHGRVNMESQAAPEPGPGPWRPCPVVDLE